VLNDCGAGQVCVEGVCKAAFSTDNGEGGSLDAGPNPDAGSPNDADGGGANDAGTLADAGTGFDGGADDGGSPLALDGGTPADAALPAASDAAVIGQDGGAPTSDAAISPPDAGAQTVDAGPPPPDDAGPPDGGPVDAGPPDAGPADAGQAQMGDSGDVDGGIADAGPPDSGPPPDAGPEPWQFFDFSGMDFMDGTHQDTEVVGAEVTLKTAKLSGTFTSRIYDVGAPAEMQQLAWMPAAPYGKPIPDDPGSTEETTAYSQDGLDLTDLVFLLHAEGTGTILQGEAVTDSAGGHLVEMEVADGVATPSSYVDGKIGQGIHIQKNDYLRIKDADTHVDFAYAGDVFTWAGWVKFDSCDGGYTDDNLILLGGEDPHIWIGARCPEETAHFQIMDDNFSGVGTSTAIDIVDGQWHHLAGVKEKTPERGILYVDGVEAEIITHDWGKFSNFTEEIFIGEFPIGTAPDYNYSSTLTFDEVVMFKRPLSAEEVGALYRRGITQLRLQVRACDLSDCGGVSFVGPDGSSTSFFSENTVPTIAPSANTFHFYGIPVPGRYFQYQLYLDTEDAAVPPIFQSMMIQGEIP
jgi:hypothetical protein